MNKDGKSISNIPNGPPQKTSDRNVSRKRDMRVMRHASLSPQPTSLQVDSNETSPRKLNDSFKDFADIKKIITSKDNKSPGKNDMTATSLCNMCCRKDDICVNLQHNHATVLTVSDITRLPSWDIRQILASVCSRCLVYISAITESSSKLRMRCEQAMHSQTVVLAPPTPDTSPNNFLQTSTTLLDDTPGHSNNEQHQHNCYAPGYCDDTPNDLSMPVAASTPPPALPLSLENRTFDTISRSPTPSNAGQNSMLRIHYERSVSPLNTESGGGGKDKKRSYQRIHVIPVQMICTHCNRAYWRKDYYRKHMRRCRAKYRYAKSVISQRSRSASRLELDAISAVSEGNEQITTHHQPRIYRCNVCTYAVDNISSLREHKRTHLPRYHCDICNNEYTSKNEYEFHRIQCAAKMEVFEKSLSDSGNKVNHTSDRRSTRSFSRAMSVVTSVTSEKLVRRNAKRTRSANEKNVVPTPNHNKNANKNNKSQYSDNENDDEYSGYASEADTLYSKRLSLTNHWVEEHSISSQSYLSQNDNYINDFEKDLQFQSLKEYDLYLLERLKIEVRLRFITCFMPGCGFTCATLNEMMVHDYIYHYKKPWFYCHKCGYCFTSKVFLDYHLDLQNKGRYVCYKCGGHFEYQHQLDRHLIQHNRLASYGGEKYVCHFCNFKFLDEDKLLKHCHYENHDCNKKRRTIEIDHSMTITNRVHQKNPTEHKTRKYQVKILNMVLKLMPSKRCTPMEKYRSNLPPHLRITKRIGQVEFRHPSNPNCVGCL